MNLIFDIETDGIHATQIYCIVAIDADTEEVYTFGPDSIDDGVALLSRANRLIGHNVIGYDIPTVDRLAGSQLHLTSVHDTWIMSQCLQYKRGHKHGLAGWGEYLQDAKIDFHDWSKFSQEMLDYCIQDCKLNLQVYRHLLKEYARIYKYNPLIQKGLQVEHAAAQMNQMMKQDGWNFDCDRAEFVRAMFEERMMQIEDQLEPKLGTKKVFIDKEPKTPKFKKDGNYNATTVRLLTDYFGHPVAETDTHLLGAGQTFQRSRVEQIRIGQQAELKEWLLKNGWKPDEYTKKKVNGQWQNVGPKLTESSLKAFGTDGEMISEYYTLRNRLSVLTGWMEKVKDGRLHGNMWTIGTPSFRARHEVIVNLPAVSASYGKFLRELFRADAGEVIVGCDSSGNQLRGLAHFVGNDEFTESVVRGKSSDGTDAHTRNANALGCDRPTAKTYLYAYLFGAGNQKLGQTLGYKGSAANVAGEKSKEDFAKNIQGLQQLKDTIEGEWEHNEATQNVGWFKGLDGRPIFCESSHQALNYLLQSTEAITCKAACAYALDAIKKQGLRARPRIFYHDEMAFSVHPEDAEAVGQILKDAFSEAPKWFGIECMDGGDYIIGDSYADVH